MEKKRTFNGKTQEEMKDVMYTMCELEDRFDDLTPEQQEALDIAFRCVATVTNRMTEERPIAWDD